MITVQRGKYKEMDKEIAYVYSSMRKRQNEYALLKL